MSDQVDVLDKAVEAGEKKLQEIKDQKHNEFLSSMNEDDRKKYDEQQKTYAEKQKADEEANLKAQEEAERLALLEDDELESLNDDEKKLREEALKNFENDDDLKKMMRANKKNLKRIDKLTARLKEAEEKLTNVENRPQPQPEQKFDVEKQLTANHQSRIEKYISEDQEKPIEQRREIKDEELDEWFLENPRQAAEWLSKRDRRREQEFNQDKHAFAFVEKQNQSVDRFRNKYPNAFSNNPKIEQEVVALKNQGRTQQEVIAYLHETYPEMKVCDQIVAEHQDWMHKDNFGDLMVAELEKRLSAKPDNTPIDKKDGVKTYSEEEVNKMVAEKVSEELKRRENVDTGDFSSIPFTPQKPDSDKLTKEEELLVAHCKKGGMSKERIDGILARHRSSKKSNSFAPDKDDNAPIHR